MYNGYISSQPQRNSQTCCCSTSHPRRRRQPGRPTAGWLAGCCCCCSCVAAAWCAGATHTVHKLSLPVHMQQTAPNTVLTQRCNKHASTNPSQPQRDSQPCCSSAHHPRRRRQPASTASRWLAGCCCCRSCVTAAWCAGATHTVHKLSLSRWSAITQQVQCRTTCHKEMQS